MSFMLPLDSKCAIVRDSCDVFAFSAAFKKFAVNKLHPIWHSIQRAALSSASVVLAWASTHEIQKHRLVCIFLDVL